MRWGLVVVGVLACRDPEAEVAFTDVLGAEARKLDVLAQQVRVREPEPIVKRAVVLDELTVDHPPYPLPPRGTKLEKDVNRIRKSVVETIERNGDRFAACAKKPGLQMVMAKYKLDADGDPQDVAAGTSLTAVVRDEARDACVADQIRATRFPGPGRVVEVWATFYWPESSETTQ